MPKKTIKKTELAALTIDELEQPRHKRARPKLEKKPRKGIAALTFLLIIIVLIGGGLAAYFYLLKISRF